MLRRQYLDAMGIQRWVGRGREEAAEVVPVQEPVVPEPEPQPRPVQEQTMAASVPPWLQDIPPPGEEYAPALDPSEAIPAGIDQAAPLHDDISGLDWDALRARVADCRLCELHGTRTQSVFGVGNTTADLLVIGEAPGADEDRQGEPFVGRAGQLLNAMLQAIGLARKEVFIANILKCRPPGNRDPRPEEALRCQPYLLRQIELVKPKAILAVGRIAAQNLLQSQEAVGKLRNRTHSFGATGIPLIVTYHPAYLLRSPDQKGKAWQDLQAVAGLLKQ
jgi:DNA polymerase